MYHLKVDLWRGLALCNKMVQMESTDSSETSRLLDSEAKVEKKKTQSDLYQAECAVIKFSAHI